MEPERAVAWEDLTPDEQVRFAERETRDGQEPSQAWSAWPAADRWRFYAECLDARIALAPDGVELMAVPLAIVPPHRAQHVRYSASQRLCVQRKGRFVEKLHGGKRTGWERRGEEVLIGDHLPADLADILVVSEEL